MARYLSPDWVQSFDAALGALDLSDAVAAAGSGSLAAADGRFSVVQVVTGVPEDVQAEGGDVHLVLTVADGQARLGLDPGRTLGGTATIVLGYADALAMARVSSTRPMPWRRGVCVCAATWPRWWPARTCWPKRRPAWAPTSKG